MTLYTGGREHRQTDKSTDSQVAGQWWLWCGAAGCFGVVWPSRITSMYNVQYQSAIGIGKQKFVLSHAGHGAETIKTLYLTMQVASVAAVTAGAPLVCN